MRQEDARCVEAGGAGRRWCVWGGGRWSEARADVKGRYVDASGPGLGGRVTVVDGERGRSR